MFLSNFFIGIDTSVNALLYVSRNDWWVKIFTWITFFGEVSTIIVLACLVSVVLWRLNNRQQMIGLWIAVVGSAIFTYLAKMIFDRPRPLNAVWLETTNSFPSGHATLVVAFYGFLAYLLLIQTKNQLYRSGIVLMSIIIIFIIGFSRLYLGVHYVSDVIGGYLVGITWLLVALFFVKRKDI